MPVAKAKSDFKPIDAGTYVARCYAVIGLGVQESKMFPSSNKCLIMWELPTETYQDPETKDQVPRTVSKEYTLSLSKKANLRHDLESWRGREFTPQELEGFDVNKVLGAPCLINLIHKTGNDGQIRAKINSVSSLPKGQKAPEGVYETVSYDIEHGRNEVFKALPEWVRKKIEASEEFTHKGVQTAEEPDSAQQPDGDSDVPF